MRKIYYFILSYYIIWATVFADAWVLGWVGVSEIRQGEIHLDNIPSILNTATDFLMWFAGTVSVVFIIIWAYKTAIGSLSNQKSAWKETILLALGGFVVASCAWVIMRIVIDNFS